MINISDKSTCCGCGACVQKCPKHCISMRYDMEGFLYPRVDSSECIGCGLCEKVCPIQNPFEPKSVLESRVAVNKKDVRIESSSGGVFFALAEYVLGKKGVVFGARFDEEWQVRIDYTESLDGVDSFLGSKYVQAFTADSFSKCENFLKQGRFVLYSGTPCQIAGLKHFLRKDYDNLLTCDVICHGSPSPGVWAKYLEEEAGELSNIKHIQFRNKQNGWKRFNFAITFKNERPNLIEYHRDNIYMRAFLSNMILRPSCYHCKAKEGCSRSDFSLADYWKVELIHPDMDDNLGTSLLLVNSSKGLNCIKLLNLNCKETSLDSAAKFNKGLRPITVFHPNRRLFFKHFESTPSVKRLIQKCVEYPWWYRLKKKIVRKLKIDRKKRTGV